MQVIKRTLLGFIALVLFLGIPVAGFWLAATYPLAGFIVLALVLSWMIGEMLCASSN